MNTFNEFGQPVGESLIDWQPRPHPSRVVLQGRYCRLEPLRMEHAHALFSAYSVAGDTRSWTWLLREPDATAEEIAEWVASVSELADPIHFTVIDNQTQSPVGTLSLMRIDPKNGVVEVGHVHFSSLLSRTPMSTEAQYLLMRYVFDTLGYRRYEWKCNSLNEPSRKAALRLGFQFEGRFRQALVIKGRNRDTDWFSILDKEWPALASAFESWLATDNFTADGKQKRSLESWRETRV
ncbi:GNAT family N-acetyltransferase [Enterobacter hormaechei]|uniref:GNAT family N-acetyltransferase n=1 Tax=Enterobacter cloacae complex TaxID=354276 RepID=UPI000F84801F|nr:GNAT family protein [Enterobacter hormaechei]EJK8585139.1 GNAT family N-acetyltransferase [Enterobacter hormaechei]EKT9839625.1 GNAT family N-acetyltransferase [Enterobacter hormaechei]EKX4900345.1 GNAT family N-acetyltransferase [Enterobacter hormaechei]ELD2091125.1 GNAT family N-acetyltransferase [Enterobacter hormaechei]ELD3413619.1 GNAT family N-acetyltransferase [Enterobacter hormaechei]